MCAKCAWAKNPNGRLLCQHCLTTSICLHHKFQFQFQKFISKTMCRIFPQVKKIIHDYRRISVLRKPKCAGVFGRSVMLTGVIFLLWMVDGYMSWAGWLQPVTAFALQSPRMDGCRLSCRIIQQCIAMDGFHVGSWLLISFTYKKTNFALKTCFL